MKIELLVQELWLAIQIHFKKMTTTPTPRKEINVGDVCSVLLRYLHPSQLISARYPNQEHGERLTNLLVIGTDTKRIRGIERRCVIFHHPEFENIQLYCSVQFARVSTAVETPEVGRVPVVLERVEQEEELHAIPRISGEAAEDIAHLRAEGYGVDDDNEPAPENVPDPTNEAPATTSSVTYLGWGARLPGFCNRRGTHNHYENASIKPGSRPHNNQRMDWFLRCLPVTYLKEVLLPETNRKMSQPMDFSELMRFIGLVLLMSTARVGCSIRDWFSEAPPSPFEGAPFRLHMYMSRSRYEEIIRSLTYTSNPKPQFKDKFWQIRMLVDCWNNNMASFFSPSWVRSCLDESMSPWTSRWTCPGWMFVPRKPHPTGNEYHTIACGLSGVLWHMEVVEGKDQPPEMRKEFDEMGKTVGLMLRVTRQIWSTGKVIILDSGFCVLKGIVELMKRGVFASALIKKRSGP